MKRFLGRIAAAVALALAARAGAAPSLDAEFPPDLGAVDRLSRADEAIRSWSPVSALAARRLFDKYGAPDEVSPGFIAWDSCSPWSRTVVHDVSLRPASVEEEDVVEQTLDYPLKPEQLGALASFDRRLSYNERTDQLSVLSGSEELNFLRMNLADDVAAGRTSPEQARARFRRTVELSQAGKDSPDLHGLHVPFGGEPKEP
jgi:hypothetical protein